MPNDVLPLLPKQPFVDAESPIIVRLGQEAVSSLVLVIRTGKQSYDDLFVLDVVLLEGGGNAILVGVVFLPPSVVGEEHEKVEFVIGRVRLLWKLRAVCDRNADRGLILRDEGREESFPGH